MEELDYSDPKITLLLKDAINSVLGPRTTSIQLSPIDTAPSPSGTGMVTQAPRTMPPRWKIVLFEDSYFKLDAPLTNYETDEEIDNLKSVLRAKVDFNYNYAALIYQKFIEKQGLEENKLVNIYALAGKRNVIPIILKLRNDIACLEKTFITLVLKTPLDRLLVVGENLPLLNNFYPFQFVVPAYTEVQFDKHKPKEIVSDIQEQKQDGFMLRHLSEAPPIDLTSHYKVFRQLAIPQRSTLIEETDAQINAWGLNEWYFRLLDEILVSNPSTLVPIVSLLGTNDPPEPNASFAEMPPNTFFFGPPKESIKLAKSSTAGLDYFNKKFRLTVLQDKISDTIQEKNRSFEEIVRGKKPHQEVVAYQIAKYSDEDFVLNEGDLKEDTMYDKIKELSSPIQSFWFFNSTLTDVVDYVDTQVKINKQYTYVVYAYLLVVESRYFYYNANISKPDRADIPDLITTSPEPEPETGIGTFPDIPRPRGEYDPFEEPPPGFPDIPRPRAGYDPFAEPELVPAEPGWSGPILLEDHPCYDYMIRGLDLDCLDALVLDDPDPDDGGVTILDDHPCYDSVTKLWDEDCLDELDFNTPAGAGGDMDPSQPPRDYRPAGGGRSYRPAGSGPPSPTPTPASNPVSTNSFLWGAPKNLEMQQRLGDATRSLRRGQSDPDLRTRSISQAVQGLRNVIANIDNRGDDSYILRSVRPSSGGSGISTATGPVGSPDRAFPDPPDDSDSPWVGPRTGPVTDIPTPREEMQCKAKFLAATIPEPLIFEIPYFIASGRINDDLPVAPDVQFIPYKDIDSKILINLNEMEGEYKTQFVVINETDQVYYENLKTQRNLNDHDLLTFSSDDNVSAYEVFRIDYHPYGFEDFEKAYYRKFSTAVEGRENPYSNSYSFDENIESNRKYYYIFRTVDINENISNPSRIFELEMVNDGGVVFPIIRVVDFKERIVKQPTKGARRLFLISPTFMQSSVNIEDLVSQGAQTAIGNLYSTLLGSKDEVIWGKTYKIRITSSKTCKKIDINISPKITYVDPGESCGPSAEQLAEVARNIQENFESVSEPHETKI